VNTARPESRLQPSRLQAELKIARLKAAAARWLHQQWQKRGLWAYLLWPLSVLALGYVMAKRRWYLRHAKTVYYAPVPVIVVGNLYVGGVGKTPVVIALVQQLLALGYHPGVISRGYGVDVGPLPRAGRGKIEPCLLGDEPALISEQTDAPVCVHPDRRLACQTLLEAYPEVDLVVSDDGLQHLALARDLEIIVQDQRQTGNGWLLPAGPLREPPNRLKSVDLVITRQEAPSQHNAASSAERPPELSMCLQITRLHSADHKISLSVKDFINFQQNKTTIAIAAIGKPDSFFKTLNDAGIAYQNSLGLPDHHPLESSFFEAQKADLLLLTTKDAVKCRTLRDPRIWVVATEAVFSDARWVTHLVQQLPRLTRLPAK